MSYTPLPTQDKPSIVPKCKLFEDDEEQEQQQQDNFLIQDRRTDKKLIGVLLTAFSGGIAAGIIAASLATIYMYYYGFNEYESPKGPFATKEAYQLYYHVRLGLAVFHILASFLCLLPGCAFLSSINEKTAEAARKTCIVALVLSSIWFLAGSIPTLFMLFLRVVYPVLFFSSFLSLLQLILSVSIFFMSCKQYCLADSESCKPVESSLNKMLQ